MLSTSTSYLQTIFLFVCLIKHSIDLFKQVGVIESCPEQGSPSRFDVLSFLIYHYYFCLCNGMMLPVAGFTASPRRRSDIDWRQRRHTQRGAESTRQLGKVRDQFKCLLCVFLPFLCAFLKIMFTMLFGNNWWSIQTN